ncbi:flagellar filament capping protein FliD [Tissierella sp. MB52-C2]|uniref:flagellar filament capping protein FliD n=1 Tax=Tissierella sp. MB52-C2 TaxID=3070999 RepID=UPI00280BCB06|nr:flagellar filament capping protein FliD [Tissierella sp. MB52-C2]WMM24156.1 flagellar filament capping protein FliD [Tissierella sp. MB52-C2]
MSLRIPGLASGMDTDMMVESMMKAERLKVSRYEQSRQISLWRQEAYNSMNKMFANFILNTKKELGLNKTTSTGAIFGSSYKNLDYVRKAISSNENVATVKSGKDTVNGSYSIKVESLASSGSFASAYMKDEQDKLVDGMTFTINGQEIKVNASGENVTMSDVVKAINAKTEDTKVTAFYDSNNGRIFMQNTTTGKDSTIDIEVTTDTDGESFVKALKNTTAKSIDGKVFEGANLENLNGENAKIKYNGVTLEYSSNNINLNGLDIELKAEGTTNINVDTNVDGIFDKITKLIDDYNNLVDMASGAISEKRYSDYQPLSQDEKKAMHEDDVKLWTEKAKSGMLNRDENLTRILQTVRNDLYRTLETEGNFKHITQIGISTEKYAKGSAGGKLQIDEDKLRKAIMEDPEGVMELLFKEVPSKPGKPNKPNPVEKEGLSEEELAKAMEDYNKDLKLYNEALRKYEKENKEYLKKNNGIFTTVYDNLIDGMKSIINKSGPGEDADLLRTVNPFMLTDFVTSKSSISDLDKEVSEMDRRIDNLNILLARKEQSYYAKFASMEKALAQMNSQSGWIGQQLMK